MYTLKNVVFMATKIMQNIFYIAEDALGHKTI